MIIKLKNQRPGPKGGCRASEKKDTGAKPYRCKLAAPCFDILGWNEYKTTVLHSSALDRICYVTRTPVPEIFKPLLDSRTLTFKLNIEKREDSYLCGPLNHVELASLICCIFSLQWETGVLVLITSLNTVQDFPEMLTLTRAVFY
jgi:hypothetical protein